MSPSTLGTRRADWSPYRVSRPRGGGSAATTHGHNDVSVPVLSRVDDHRGLAANRIRARRSSSSAGGTGHDVDDTPRLFLPAGDRQPPSTASTCGRAVQLRSPSVHGADGSASSWPCGRSCMRRITVADAGQRRPSRHVARPPRGQQRWCHRGSGSRTRIIRCCWPVRRHAPAHGRCRARAAADRRCRPPRPEPAYMQDVGRRPTPGAARRPQTFLFEAEAAGQLSADEHLGMFHRSLRRRHPTTSGLLRTARPRRVPGPESGDPRPHTTPGSPSELLTLDAPIHGARATRRRRRRRDRRGRHPRRRSHRCESLAGRRRPRRRRAHDPDRLDVEAATRSSTRQFATGLHHGATVRRLPVAGRGSPVEERFDADAVATARPIVRAKRRPNGISGSSPRDHAAAASPALAQLLGQLAPVLDELGAAALAVEAQQPDVVEDVCSEPSSSR